MITFNGHNYSITNSIYCLWFWNADFSVIDFVHPGTSECSSIHLRVFLDKGIRNRKVNIIMHDVSFIHFCHFDSRNNCMFSVKIMFHIMHNLNIHNLCVLFKQISFCHMTHTIFLWIKWVNYKYCMVSVSVKNFLTPRPRVKWVNLGCFRGK